MRNTDVPICLLTVCTVQLYNEEVNDLLAPENTKLPIHESKENGIYVCGLREDIVTGPDQVLALLEEGESNRHVGSTKMNDQSSRSHTLFRMVGGRAGGEMVRWGRRRAGGGEEADPICKAPPAVLLPYLGRSPIWTAPSPSSPGWPQWWRAVHVPYNPRSCCP